MSKSQTFQRTARLAAAMALVSLSAGCGKAPLTQMLPSGNENSFLAPQAGSLSLLPTGAVTGRVLDDRAQTGIPGVLVQVENVSPPVQAITDASGNFILPRVPQGRQTLSVLKTGYIYLDTQGSIQANVMPNGTTSVPGITLTPAIASASNAFMTSIGGMVAPYGIAIDTNRKFLYAIDRIGFSALLDKRSEVKKFDLGGGALKHFGGELFGFQKSASTGGLFNRFSHLSWAYGLDVDAGGNVYVADTNNDRVVKFSANGDYLDQFNHGLSNDYDAAVLNTGNIAVSSSGNSQIALFNVDLSPSANQFPGTANAAANNGGLRGVAVDATNFLYAIDTGAGPGSAIKKYALDASQPVLTFGTNNGAGPGQFSGATDLAIDNRNGDIYVVDSGNNRVERFDATGRFVSEFGSAGRANGQFDRPYGIAIDANGNVYVSDTGNRRIEKFAPGRVGNAPASSAVTYPTK